MKHLTLIEARQALDPATYRKYVEIIRLHRLAPGDVRIAVRWDESQHPREPAGSPTGGQFTSGGGGGEGGETKPDDEDGTLDPKVVEVGGDEWNRATARRLEREYQAARPKLDELAQQSVGEEAEAPTDDEEEEGEPPYEPESWEMLSASGQSQAESEWTSQNKDSYYESEVSNWQDSGGAADDAGAQMEYEFNKGNEQEWAEDAINELREERVDADELNFPYTNTQLLDAIKITWETGWEGNVDKSLTIEFDDSKLQDPIDKPPPPDPAQLELPGTPPPGEADYSTHLTDEMREELIDALTKAFENEQENVADKMEPPEYLLESAEEYAGEVWEQMSDEDKFEWTKNHTDIVSDETTEGTGSYADEKPPSESQELDALPKQFDPLNETTGTDYRRTQALARILSVERTQQVFEARSLDVPSDSSIARADKQIWSAWKGSSTSTDGMLLQVATAEELGGRLNLKTATEIDPEYLKEYANTKLGWMGGYAGIKAYVRAKWEVTQYLLDKAGKQELELFRGIKIDNEIYQKMWRKHISHKHYDAADDVKGYKYMSTLDVVRNGCASTSTSAGVSNGWGNDSNRVVLRALVPRTAALSIPAYGINVHSEKEVVVAGTAWKGWDAWGKKAPDFDAVPLKHAA